MHELRKRFQNSEKNMVKQIIHITGQGSHNFTLHRKGVQQSDIVNLNSQIDEERLHILRLENINSVNFPSKKVVVRFRACTLENSCSPWSCCNGLEFTLEKMISDYVVYIREIPKIVEIDGDYEDDTICAVDGGCKSLSQSIKKRFERKLTIFFF